MYKKKNIKRLNQGIERGEIVEIIYDGKPIKAHRGETIATALMAEGHLSFRTVDGNPMGLYCNSGVCHSCIMKVNGLSGVRTCQTPVSEGCRVETQRFEKGE